jgi:hypothetical protein
MFILYKVVKFGNILVLDTTYLYIIQPNHKLLIGDKITIISSPDYNIVPKEAIIGEKTIVDVNNYTDFDNVISHNVNNIILNTGSFTVADCLTKMGYTTPFPSIYKIELPSFIPLNLPENIPTGFSPYLDFSTLPYKDTTFICNTPVNVTTVLNPESIRMFFSQPDTMGKILGFRDSGVSSSITSYKTVIYNYDPYDFETLLGLNLSKIKQNAINLKGETYILMTSPTFNANPMNDKVDDVFTKIQLSTKHGETAFNTYVGVSKEFTTPITDLFEIEFIFKNYLGELYDFNGLDHSFTIEIIELIVSPKDTHVNTQKGYNDLYLVNGTKQFTVPLL